MEEMNLFGSVEHNDDNSDKWPDLCGNPTNQDLLDYMVLVIARFAGCQLAFKGGYMLNQLLGGESHQTSDVDFSVVDEKSYEGIKDILRRIAEFFVERGLISRYTLKGDIAPGRPGGIDFYGSDGTRILGVDVGMHNLSYRTTKYDISVGEVEGFSIERMLSDKILAILSRKRFRRTKDLYDFYVLVHHYDFSYETLLYCTENRDNYDNSVWDNIPFSEIVLEQYAIAWNKLRLVSYTEGSDLLKPEFGDVIALFNRIAFTVKGHSDKISSWNHVDMTWRY